LLASSVFDPRSDKRIRQSVRGGEVGKGCGHATGGDGREIKLGKKEEVIVIQPSGILERDRGICKGQDQCSSHA
jgi:hypothetical protein